jgi:hypothetical protein
VSARGDGYEVGPLLKCNLGKASQLA